MGDTLKNIAKKRFYCWLEAYKKALESGNGHAIAIASLQIHIACADVPKYYQKMVKKVAKTTSCKKQNG